MGVSRASAATLLLKELYQENDLDLGGAQEMLH